MSFPSETNKPTNIEIMEISDSDAQETWSPQANVPSSQQPNNNEPIEISSDSDAEEPSSSPQPQARAAVGAAAADRSATAAASSVRDEPNHAPSQTRLADNLTIAQRAFAQAAINTATTDRSTAAPAATAEQPHSTSNRAGDQRCSPQVPRILQLFHLVPIFRSET